MSPPRKRKRKRKRTRGYGNRNLPGHYRLPKKEACHKEAKFQCYGFWWIDRIICKGYCEQGDCPFYIQSHIPSARVLRKQREKEELIRAHDLREKKRKEGKNNGQPAI